MNRNLRLSLVTETYFPQVNGVSRTLDRLISFCADQGDRIQLLIPRYPDYATNLPPGVERSAWSAVSLPFYREVVLPMVTTSKVGKVLSAFRPDIVHIATEGPLGRAALLAARRLQLPVVSSYHTNFAQYLRDYHAGFLAPLCWRYLRWFHNATLATYCPAASTRRRLEEAGFRNVAIWSRGVDSQRFHPGKRDDELRLSLGLGPDDLLMSYAGRIASEKNLEMLLQAWRLLPERPNRYLMLIGDGPLRERLAAERHPRILYPGYCYGEDLARMYASSDLFIFPSLTETFGNVILEAMASGLPVIGFNVQGPGDIIRHEDTGILVSQVSARSLAAAMAGLLEDQRGRREMGSRARSYAACQTWEEIMSGLRRDYLGHVERAEEGSTAIPGQAGTPAKRPYLAS